MPLLPRLQAAILLGLCSVLIACGSATPDTKAAPDEDKQPAPESSIAPESPKVVAYYPSWSPSRLVNGGM